MTNCKNLDSFNSRTAAIRPAAHSPWRRRQKLILMGYLTPSLNKLLHKHWTVAHKAKEAARAALAAALRDCAS